MHAGALAGSIIRFHVRTDKGQYTVRFTDPRLNEIVTVSLREAMILTRKYLCTFPSTDPACDSIITNSLDYHSLYEQSTHSVLFDASCSKSFAELKMEMQKSL